MITKSRAAQLDWHHKYSLEQRLALIKAGIRAIAEKKDALAVMISREMGKVASEATEEVEGAIDKNEVRVASNKS